MKQEKAEKRYAVEQARDTGLAVCLLLLLLIHFGNYPRLIPVVIVLLLLSMLWPRIFGPLSIRWLKFSSMVSAVMSKIILVFLFFGIVTPVGLSRRLIGADPMQFNKWKKGKGSVFMTRDKAINAKDLKQPY